MLANAAYGVHGSTVAQYRAQANAICVQEDKQLNALPSGLTLATYLPHALTIARAAYTSLSRLSPPASLSGTHADLLANVKAGFPIVSGLLARARAGKLTVAQFEADKSLAANVTRENGLWKKIGAKKCLT